MSLSQLFDVAIEEARSSGKHVIVTMGPLDGDIKHIWDPAVEDEVDGSRELFARMRDKGHAAYRVDKDGEKAEVMHEFDPGAEAIIFAPPLIGG